MSNISNGLGNSGWGDPNGYGAGIADLTGGTLNIGTPSYSPMGDYGYGSGTSGLGALADRAGSYAGNFFNSPSSWTGDNTRQALINAAGFIPGVGMLPSIGAGLAEGFHIVDPAGGTGSGAGNLAGQSGMVQDLTREGADWAYHNIFGGDYSNAEQVAPLNKSVNDTIDKFNNDYSLAQQQQNGTASTALNPGPNPMNWSSRVTYESLYGPVSNEQWDSVKNWKSLAGTPGYGESKGGGDFIGAGDGGGYNYAPPGFSTNTSGWQGGYGSTRLDGTGLGNWGGGGMDFLGFLPVSPQGSARGGPVRLGNNSFVVDARTVSELGNGSSSAGQELLARLGGQPIHGPGDGVSDSIHANIGGKQEARVARDEVQFSPEAVARLGGGDTSKGSKFLYSLMAKAREARIKAAKKDGGRGVDTGLRALVGAK